MRRTFLEHCVRKEEYLFDPTLPLNLDVHILHQIYDNKKDIWKERVKRFVCRSRFVASRKVFFREVYLDQ